MYMTTVNQCWLRNDPSFCRLFDENVVILSQIFGNQVVIPEFEDFCGQIEKIYERCKSNQTGKVCEILTT